MGNFNKSSNGSLSLDLMQTLYEANCEEAYKAAYSITLDRELSQDVVHEAFMRAFVKFDTLNDRSKFKQWLCTIVYNICRDILRSRRRTNSYVSLDDPNINDDYLFSSITDKILPDVVCENNELKEQLMKSIRQLKEDERSIIYYKYFKYMTYDEIAVNLDMKESTVRVKAKRAKMKMCEEISEYMAGKDKKIDG